MSDEGTQQGQENKFCSNCGTELPHAAANFCPRCGTAQDPAAAVEVPGGSPSPIPQPSSIPTPIVPGVPQPGEDQQPINIYVSLGQQHNRQQQQQQRNQQVENRDGCGGWGCGFLLAALIVLGAIVAFIESLAGKHGPGAQAGAFVILFVLVAIVLAVVFELRRPGSVRGYLERLRGRSAPPPSHGDSNHDVPSDPFRAETRGRHAGEGGGPDGDKGSRPNS